MEQLPGYMSSPFRSHGTKQPGGQLWSGLNLCETQFLQVNTLTPDLPERERLAWHSPPQPGWSPGAESVAARRWQIAARWFPHNTNYVRENKCLQSLKQVPRNGRAETALHRTALILGWHRPSPEAIALIVGNNRSQQRKQQNLHNQ